MFTSIFENTTATLSITDALICMISSLGLGIIVALTHTLTKKYTKNFITVLVFLGFVSFLFLQMLWLIIIVLLMM